MLALGVAALLILVQFNTFSIVLGLASAAPVAVYPFMKRNHLLAAALLGNRLQLGALLGWAAVEGLALALPPILLLCRRDRLDARLRHHLCPPGQGRRPADRPQIRPPSNSGAATPRWLALFFALALLLTGPPPGCGRGGMGLHHRHLSPPRSMPYGSSGSLTSPTVTAAWMLFRSNRDWGLLIFAGAVLDSLMKGGANLMTDKDRQGLWQAAGAGQGGRGGRSRRAGGCRRVPPRSRCATASPRSSNAPRTRISVCGFWLARVQAVVSTSRDDR